MSTTYAIALSSLTSSHFRSDPVLEPMLQSVPDPFDSYGPPKAEDSIFSILPPLSVIASAPSLLPTPMSKTSESGTSTPLASASGGSAWVPSNGFPDSPSEWVDGLSPPYSMSPPPVNRRNSHPPSSSSQLRKSESKLRSVLPAIDETRPRSQHSSHTSIPDTQSTQLHGLNGSSSHEVVIDWVSTHGQPPHVDPMADIKPRSSSPHSPKDSSGATTPRHSTPPSVQLEEPPDEEANYSPQSDDTAQVPIPT
jgi:hypothetical protein